jgi:hypothetical protein
MRAERIASLQNTLAGINMIFVAMARPRFCARLRPRWFPSAPPVATLLPRNVTGAKDPLNPNRLRVTPLAPRDTLVGEDDRTIQNNSLNQCIITRFLSHNLIFIAITSG